MIQELERLIYQMMKIVIVGYFVVIGHPIFELIVTITIVAEAITFSCSPNPYTFE